MDELSAYTYEATATTKGMANPSVGVGQAYLGAYRDKQGHAFDGAKTYRLRIPANASAENFWSLTLYDLDTRRFIENKREIPGPFLTHGTGKEYRRIGGSLFFA